MTIQQWMDFGFCRGFSYDELCNAMPAGAPQPTGHGYRAHCILRDQEVDDFCNGLAQQMDDAAFSSAPARAPQHNAHVLDFLGLEVGIPI